jgi:hypothetical protein
MLRRAETAEIITTGWVWPRAWFWPGTGEPVRLPRRHHRALIGDHERRPVQVAVVGARTYWMFRHRFYWDRDGLDDHDVHALLVERERRQARQIERAHLVAGRALDGDREGGADVGEGGAGADAGRRSARPGISDEVKTFVWQRDGGRCVRCGTDAALEFDHVIPLALGGSSTARNLQLLCEGCNRTKGAALT